MSSIINRLWGNNKRRAQALGAQSFYDYISDQEMFKIDAIDVLKGLKTFEEWLDETPEEKMVGYAMGYLANAEAEPEKYPVEDVEQVKEAYNL